MAFKPNYGRTAERQRQRALNRGQTKNDEKAALRKAERGGGSLGDDKQG